MIKDESKVLWVSDPELARLYRKGVVEGRMHVMAYEYVVDATEAMTVGQLR